MKKRLIGVLLAMALVPWQPLIAQAANTTKTILVKGINGNPYAGALVKAYWFTDDAESTSSLQVRMARFK